jgi:hypothetical protein
MGRALHVEERHKLEQDATGGPQSVAEGAPHGEILVSGLSERGHSAPPGQATASVRNAARSILA